MSTSWMAHDHKKKHYGRPSVKIRTHSLVSNIYVDVINHDLCLFPHPSQSRVNLHQVPKHLEYFAEKGINSFTCRPKLLQIHEALSLATVP